jgi:hypothetical protein
MSTTGYFTKKTMAPVLPDTLTEDPRIRTMREEQSPRSYHRRRTVLVNRSRLDSAMTVSAPAYSIPMLLAELVELGRESWRITEQERAIRAQIEALRELEENQ